MINTEVILAPLYKVVEAAERNDADKYSILNEIKGGYRGFDPKNQSVYGLYGQLRSAVASSGQL